MQWRYNYATKIIAITKALTHAVGRAENTIVNECVVYKKNSKYSVSPNIHVYLSVSLQLNF